MKIVESHIIGKVYNFQDLKHVLKGLGFSMAESYTYNYAPFTYPLHTTKLDYSYYVRVFVDAVKGQIDAPGCEVQISEIEILTALYHQGYHRDVEVPAQYVKQAEELLKKFHNALQEEPKFTIVDAQVEAE